MNISEVINWTLRIIAGIGIAAIVLCPFIYAALAARTSRR